MMIPDEKDQKVALFRFGVIAPLVGLKKSAKGEREKTIKNITTKQWDIPFSGRSYISRSTVFSWLKRYEDSGREITSLIPLERNDVGLSRKLDKETEISLVNLKKELKDISLNLLLDTARDRNILPFDFNYSTSSLYRLFKKYGVNEINEKEIEDMRKFEAELPNDLWQSDCMHGPKIKIGGILKKTFLFAFIDDHSRIIPHAEFYLQENLDNYLKCLKIAINKRGLPRKLYVDNGPSFRSLKLEYITASLSIALLHAKPYRPEGKGKIERWFKTVQVNFIPSIFSPLSLAELNLLLQEWIDKEYHIRKHSSTKEAPLERYIRQIQLIRKSPTDIDKYFRNQIKRKVAKDRTISFKGKLYEAPVELIGKYVFLFYDEDDLNNIEIYYNKKSYGKLVVLNPHINYKVSRNNHVLGFTLKKEKHITEVSAAQDYQLKTGQLFERGEN